MKRRLGIHTSIADSLEKAARKAAELGANTFQIFSASPRMWRASPPAPEAVNRLREARVEYDLKPLVIHANYLINLASADPLIRAKSVAGFRGELERADAIGAEFLVLHPGSYKGQTIEEGIAAFAAGLREATHGLGPAVEVLLENTVGAGRKIGGRLEELRAIHALVEGVLDVSVGYCLDTCHLLAAGFDIATEAGLRDTVRAIEQSLGLKNVKVMHANDSKTGLGSHVDRHENIGEGHIGKAGFRRILTHPRFRSKPFILETPVDEEGDDRRNLDRLKRLCQGR